MEPLKPTQIQKDLKKTKGKNSDCGTSGIIKGEMTCKKCQKPPTLNNKEGICINCEKK